MTILVTCEQAVLPPCPPNFALPEKKEARSQVTMLMFQTNPVGVEVFSHVKTLFCSNKIYIAASHLSENALYRGHIFREN